MRLAARRSLAVGCGLFIPVKRFVGIRWNTQPTLIHESQGCLGFNKPHPRRTHHPIKSGVQVLFHPLTFLLDQGKVVDGLGIACFGSCSDHRNALVDIPLLALGLNLLPSKAIESLRIFLGMGSQLCVSGGFSVRVQWRLGTGSSKEPYHQSKLDPLPHHAMTRTRGPVRQQAPGALFQQPAQ